MIPKPLHRAYKDYKALNAKVQALGIDEDDEGLHDEADRLDVEFSVFTQEQRDEGDAMYLSKKLLVEMSEMRPIKKTVMEKFLSGEELSF